MPAPANNLPVAVWGSPEATRDQWRIGYVVSGAIHLGIILLLIFGLPHVKKAEPEPQAISVTFAPASDIARTTREDEPSKEPEKPPEIVKAVEPPKPPPPPPPTPPQEPLPELKPVTPPQQQVQEFGDLPPLAKPIKIIKPTPPAPAKPNDNQAPSKRQDQDFQSMLTNLSAPVPKVDQPTKERTQNAKPPPSARASLSNAMTADELALIRDRIKECWVVPAGAYNAGNLVVNVIGYYNPDMTLKSEKLDDAEGRYQSDPYYRAAADSAMRALHNPRCNPMPFPPGKEADWSEISMKFDPKQMIGP